MSRARAAGHIPKGAGFGHDTPGQGPRALDYGEIAANGSRAQRRWAKRLIRRARINKGRGK